MRRFSIFRWFSLTIAITATLACGAAAVFSFPIIVLADSDGGAAAMVRVRDAMVLFCFSVGAIFVLCRVIPWPRLRIAVALAIVATLAAWSFESAETPYAARCAIMVIFGLVMGAELVEFSCRRKLALIVVALLPCMLILTDWSGRIYFGLLPSPLKLNAQGLRTSISLMAGGPARATSPASGLQATGSNDGTLTIQDMNGGPALVMPTLRSDRVLQALSFSPDGKTLAVADNHRMYVDSIITVWDITAGTNASLPKASFRHALAGPRHWNFSLDIFPDGRTLVAANGDKTIRLWDLVTGKELAQFVGHQNRYGDENADCVAAAPDGKTFVTWAWSGLKLWDRNSLKLLRTMDTRGRCPCALAFTPDGRQLIATDREGSCVWEVAPSPLLFVVLLGGTLLVVGWSFYVCSARLKEGGAGPSDLLPAFSPHQRKTTSQDA
jgi:WD40 repeat protein